MSTLQANYNPTTKIVTVQAQGDAIPEGSVAIGTFEHPDPVYPGSVVIFHGVRDLLYKRKPNGAEGFWPDNITDLQNISIVQDDVIELVSLELSPASLALTVGNTDQLTAERTPVNGIGTIIWSTDDPEVATVSEDGEVTAVGAGTANITATVGTITASAEVTVTAE